MMTEKLHDLIWKEDGFEVRLRCENCFDHQEYSLIRESLLEQASL